MHAVCFVQTYWDTFAPLYEKFMEDENIPLARTLVSATGAMAYASAFNNTHSAAIRFDLIVLCECVSPWLAQVKFS